VTGNASRQLSSFGDDLFDDKYISISFELFYIILKKCYIIPTFFHSCKPMEQGSDTIKKKGEQLAPPHPHMKKTRLPNQFYCVKVKLAAYFKPKICER
jgi:hypothetical protein